MANAKTIHVKEDVKTLKSLLKAQPSSLRSRLIMLLEIKKSKQAQSKNELARLVGVNHNSIQSWRQIYLRRGIGGLLTHQRGGKRREVITPAIHRAVAKRLKSPDNAFTSFSQLQQWVAKHYLPTIKYVTINAYVKKHFQAKLKVARRSHINKDQQAVDAFKKNG